MHPIFLAPLAGPAFLGSIGVGFALVYLADRSHWWAIIPGGVLGTLAAVAAIDEVGYGDIETGGIPLAWGSPLTGGPVASSGRRAPYLGVYSGPCAHGLGSLIYWVGKLLQSGLAGYLDFLIGIFWVIRNAVRPK